MFLNLTRRCGGAKDVRKVLKNKASRVRSRTGSRTRLCLRKGLFWRYPRPIRNRPCRCETHGKPHAEMRRREGCPQSFKKQGKSSAKLPKITQSSQSSRSFKNFFAIFAFFAAYKIGGRHARDPGLSVYVRGSKRNYVRCAHSVTAFHFLASPKFERTLPYSLLPTVYSLLPISQFPLLLPLQCF